MPWGTFWLDPHSFVVYGTAVIPRITLGANQASVSVPIPSDARLFGVLLHWQAINAKTVAPAGPLFTNAIITTVQ